MYSHSLPPSLPLCSGLPPKIASSDDQCCMPFPFPMHGIPCALGDTCTLHLSCGSLMWACGESSICLLLTFPLFLHPTPPSSALPLSQLVSHNPHPVSSCSRFFCQLLLMESPLGILCHVCSHLYVTGLRT